MERAIVFVAPATGYRARTTGELMNVGAEGYFWSSASYFSGDINAARLNINSTNVNPLNGGHRSYAFSVRCVQHLPVALLKVKGEKLKVKSRK